MWWLLVAALLLLQGRAQFYPDRPIVWRVTPALGSTQGGTEITIIGENFLAPGQCTTDPVVTLVWSPEDVRNCPVTFHASSGRELRCTIPAGQGAPELVVNICGQIQLHLPRFGSDFFFWGGPGDPPNDKKHCIQTSYGTTWSNNNWFCGKDNRAMLGGYMYFGTSPPANSKCVLVTNAGQPSNLNNRRICFTNADAPYNGLTWHVTTGSPPAGLSCVLWKDADHAAWNNDNHWMCAPTGTPYGTDGLLRYHYGNPVLSSVTPSSGPVAGGSTVVLTGASLGTSGQVFFGAQVASCYLWTHTAITCTSPSGEGITAVRVTVSGKSSNTLAFTYDRPVISGVSPPEGDTRGGYLLTITGSNFGLSGATVTIDGRTCAISTYSNTLIRCTVPAGQGAGLPLIVTTTVGALTNLVPRSWSYSRPRITAFTPATAETVGNVRLRINGTSMGTAGSITVGGKACPLMGSGWSHTYVECLLPAGQGRNQRIVATCAGQSSTDGTFFHYDAPQITEISPLGAVSGMGAQLTIYGTSFGTSGSISVGGKACLPLAGQHQDRRIVCALPTGEGVDRPVFLNISGQVSNTVFFHYAAHITGAVMLGDGKAPTAGGGTLQITGFGFSTAAVTPALVTINGLQCNVLTQADTVITCTLPPGGGTDQPLVVTLRGVASAPWPFDYDEPELFSVAPTLGPTIGGTLILLQGANFGTAPTVLVGVSPCTIVERNHTTVLCRTPEGSGVDRTVQVCPSALSCSNPLTFSYLGPTLTSVSPLNGDSAGGYPITLRGENLGVAGSGLVAMSGVVCIPTFHNHTTVIFTAPPGVSVVFVNAIIDSQSSNGLAFTYDRPIITSLDPPEYWTEGNIVLTIRGRNFGTSGMATVGDKQCFITGAGWSQTRIECILPSGVGEVPVIISSGVQTSLPFSFHYRPPNVTSISPTNANTNAGTLLTINGKSFGSTGTVKIGPYTCRQNVPGFTWSDVRITCGLPLAEGRFLPVEVTVAEKTNPYKPLFSYNPPVISNILPPNGPTQGGTVLTVFGSNFGLSATITFLPSSVCTPTGLGQTHTQIQCILPAGQGLGVGVQADVGGQSSVPRPFNYDRAVITRAFPLTGPTQGGLSVTFEGRNFGVGTDYVITLGGRQVTTVTLFNHTTVVWTLPRGTGTGHALSLEVAGQAALYTGPAFAYEPPSITSVSGCQEDVFPQAAGCGIGGGITITVDGSNLSNNASLVAVTVDSLPCTSLVITADDTQLTCVLAAQPYGGYNVAVRVTVDGQSVSRPWLSYIGPVITANTLMLDSETASTGHVDLPAMPPPGIIVRFEGRYFGSNESSVVIRYGLPGSQPKPLLCPIVPGSLTEELPSQNSAVACIINEGAGANLVFEVSVGFLTSQEGTDTLSYPRPEVIPETIRGEDIASLKKPSHVGQFSEGDPLHFGVRNVGLDASLVKVHYGPPGGAKNLECTNVQLFVFEGEQTIKCITTAGTGTGLVFVVTANGYASEEGQDTYSYPIAPTVSRVSGCPQDVGNTTSECPTAGGTLISIHGTDFDETGLSVRIGRGSCTNPQLLSSSLVTCQTPSGAGLDLGVSVIVGTRFSQPANLLSYKAATITSVSGCTLSGVNTIDCPRAGGTEITVRGANFGPPTAVVLIGGVLCTSVMHHPFDPHGELRCVLQSGTQQARQIILVQSGGELSVGTPYVSYALCARGQFAPVGTVTCSPCPAGSYSDVPGTFSCKPCEAGRFAPSGRSVCDRCTRGTFSAASAGSCTDCPPGSFSNLDGSPACTPCGVGRYATAPGSTRCESCPAGRYIDQTGWSSTCPQCGPGEFSATAGAGTCAPCPVGTRSQFSTGSSRCQDCFAGQYTSIAGATICSPCAAGYAQPLPRQASCASCDAGFFTDQPGRYECERCPAGSFSVKLGDQGAIQCTLCPPGEYQPVEGSASCLACDRGEWTPGYGATACLKCNAGTYTNVLSSSSCLPCPAGTYAPTNGTIQCEECPSGSYSPAPGAAVCTPCEPGYQRAPTSRTRCDACAVGKATAVVGSLSCSDCEPGRFANVTGLATCHACPPGFFSAAGASTCSPCAAGKITATSRLATCSDCPAGSFQASPGKSSCQPCPAGSASSEEGAVSCTNCTAGKFSGPGALLCIDCPAGSVNNRPGQSSCTPCTAGQFSPSAGLQECVSCPSGSISQEGAFFCSVCPAGSFAPGGGASCFPCPVGHFNPVEGSSSCQRCDPGSAQVRPG